MKPKFCILFYFLAVVCRVQGENVTWSSTASVINLEDVEDALDDKQGILNWAIENSDPEELRNRAKVVQIGEEGNGGVDKQRDDIQELIRLVREQPTETELMKDALEQLQRPNATDFQISESLATLKLLVESIDNANDMKALDGIKPIVSFLERGPPFDGQAALVLGKAASNNPKFQNDTIEACPDVLDRLIKMTSSKAEESVSKAVYALASLVRNLMELRTMFYAKGGLLALHNVLVRQPPSLSLERKCLGLLADLLSLDNIEIKDKDFLRVILLKVDHNDLDIMEKALNVLTLLQQTPASSNLLDSLDLGENSGYHKVDLCTAAADIVCSSDSRVSSARSRLMRISSKEPDSTYLTDILDLVDTILNERLRHGHDDL